MARNATWTNDDGLVVGFGTHSEDNNVAGVTQSSGGRVTVKQEITLADLADTFAATNVDPQAVRIPRGSVITNAYLEVKVAAVGASATLDIGTWGVGLATEVVDDADGIVADASTAELNAIGEVHICDGALVASSGNTAAAGVVCVGATSDSDVVIAPSYETAAFTAGVVLLHVEYIPPSGSAGRTLAA